MRVRRPKWHGLFAAATILLTAPEGVAVAANEVTDQAQPTAHWTKSALSELVAIVEDSAKEGLRPDDYDLAGLKTALGNAEEGAADARATVSALALAHDYYFGRVSDRSGMQWLIDRSPYDGAELPAQLQQAIDRGKLRQFFEALLPVDPRYRALRDALADAAAGPARDRLRVNLERWRWMPRVTPSDYLYVNVPSYRLQLFQSGLAVASFDIVVGAKETPTPQMVSPTASLIVNPAWYVPPSIVRKSGLRAGRDGYVWKAMGDGSRYLVQLPGPRNTLGRIKFNLANDQSIYLHDTNSKRVFDRDDRALSHGCIRVKDIDQLAASLLNQGGDGIALDEALASPRTATLRLPRTWPVYIVYFTADVDETGAVATYGDPYGYDAQVLAALGGARLVTAAN
jgi:murein L,D-transpeptidase YcbB/YkuD